jgi:hypothetical protein
MVVFPSGHADRSRFKRSLKHEAKEKISASCHEKSLRLMLKIIMLYATEFFEEMSMNDCQTANKNAELSPVIIRDTRCKFTWTVWDSALFKKNIKGIWSLILKGRLREQFTGADAKQQRISSETP